LLRLARGVSIGLAHDCERRRVCPFTVSSGESMRTASGFPSQVSSYLSASSFDRKHLLEPLLLNLRAGEFASQCPECREGDTEASRSRGFVNSTAGEYEIDGDRSIKDVISFRGVLVAALFGDSYAVKSVKVVFSKECGRRVGLSKQGTCRVGRWGGRMGDWK
jgi:hypothetical protein